MFLLRLAEYAKGHWHRLIIGLSAMIASGAIAIWPTWTLKLVADFFSVGGEYNRTATLSLMPRQLIELGAPNFEISVNPVEALNYVPWVLLGIFLLDGMLRFFDTFNTRMFGVLIASSLRLAAHRKLFTFSLQQLRSRHTGDLISCLTNDLSLLQTLLAEVLSCLFKDTISALALTLWLFSISWQLTALGLIVLPIFFMVIGSLFRQLRKLARLGQTATAEISSAISETVGGFDVIIMNNRKAERQNRFESDTQNFVNIWRSQLLFDAAISPLLGILSAFGIGVVAIWFGFRQVLEGNLTLGDFSSYIIATVLLYQPIKRLLRVNAQINQLDGTCERLFTLLAEPEGEPDEADLPKDANSYTNIGAVRLKFCSVNFAYSNDRPALKDVSFDVEGGERIALVGASGSGKSTLLKLIPRLYLPNAGCILLNGRDIANWALNDLRTYISLVEQDPFLFSGTLRENILLAKPNATAKELELTLYAANLDFLDKLPGGLDCTVGERGLGLSGGQRQRVALARAFLRDAPMILLDEPTSSLDQGSEEAIKQALFRLMQGRTVIMATHKLSLIEDFDQILCIADGTIVENGTHEQLLNQGGKYCDLIQTTKLV